MTPALSKHERMLVAGQLLVLDSLAVEAFEALRAEGIPSIVLKGPVTSHWLYPDGARGYGDVDLLVSPRQMGPAGEVLRRLGLRYQHEGARESEETWKYEQVWGRGPLEWLELHRSFFGMPDDQAFWNAAVRHTAPVPLQRGTVDGPDRVLAAVLYALHAAQHGVHEAKPLEDLRRAVTRFEEPVWVEALGLATVLGAQHAVGVGLRLVPGGVVLADRIGAPASAPVSVWVKVIHPHGHAGEYALNAFLRAPSAAEKLRVLRDLMLPSPGILIGHRPWAGRNTPLLVLAYLRRWARMVTLVPSLAARWWSGWSAARRSR